MGNIYNVALVDDLSHQISPKTQYKTTMGNTERYTKYHSIKFHRKMLMAATIITKRLKNQKIFDFENRALSLTLSYFYTKI